MPFNLQACDCVAKWICGRVVRDGLHDSRRDHVHCQERFTETRILRVDVVHVAYCTYEGRDIDLVQIQSKKAVMISFDADDSVDAESGGCLDVFPGDYGDIPLKGPQMQQRLDEPYAFF